MNTKIFCIAVLAAMVLSPASVLAKDKGDHGRGHDRHAREENSNRQFDPYSQRGLDRAEERHDMQDRRDDDHYDGRHVDQYGRPYPYPPRYQDPNPLNNMINNAADQLKQGINRNLPAPPPPQPVYPQQGYRQPVYPQGGYPPPNYPQPGYPR